MLNEGDSGHIYEDVPAIRNFVVDVSKVHDWLNSWNYSAGGLYSSRGIAFDSMFQVYSFSGMLPAAAMTAVGLPSMATADQRMLIDAVRQGMR